MTLIELISPIKTQPPTLPLTLILELMFLVLVNCFEFYFSGFAQIAAHTPLLVLND
jgi:hypothetical protein